LLLLAVVHSSPKTGALAAAPQSDAFIRVLLVENAEESATQQILAHAMPAAFQTVHVRTLDEALRVLSVARFDVVLLDLLLPDADGVAAVTAVHDANAGAPIIALAAPEDLALGDACIREGAQDCLLKDELTERALARAIRYAIERVRNQEALRQLSLTDELTGLYNRRGLGLLGEQQLKLARRSGRGFVLATIDVDGLKSINDTFGHQEGDVALVQTANILRSTFRSADVIARTGGDEFVVLAVDAATAVEPIVADRLRERLAEHNRLHGRGYTLSFTIGTTRVDPARASTLDQWIGEADKHLYTGKRALYGRVLAFPPRHAITMALRDQLPTPNFQRPTPLT
jgi:diguanylate cyclase (GGDEF)-like protein